MLKILRKYNKWVLGIGGSLLMVTFLFSGTSSLFQPDPRKRVIAEVSTGKLRALEVGLADRESKALKAFAPQTMTRFLGIEDGMHWLLLAREAQAAGLVGEASDGREWIPDIARLEAEGQLAPNAAVLRQVGLYDQYVDQTATQALGVLSSDGWKARAAQEGAMSLPELETALAKLRGVYRLLTVYSQTPRFSGPRASQIGRRIIDQVFVDAIVIPAAARVSSVPEATEEQLKAHFEKYKGVEPGTGEMGFGYVLPEQVKLEWMVIDRALVEAAVTIDPLAAYRAWQADRAQFAGEFEAERTKVETLLRTQNTEKVLAEADRIIKARIRSATRRLVTDDGVKRLPPEWEAERPKLTELATAVADGVKGATGTVIPAPRVIDRSAQWTRIADAGSLEGIGGASFRVGTRQGTLGQLLSMTHELSGVAGSLVQARVTFDSPLTDPAGNVYYLTVLDARKPAPAQSLDEVRAQVVEDARNAAAFAILAGEQAAIKDRAISAGLESIASEFLPGTPAAEAVTKGIRVGRGGISGPLRELDTQRVRDAIVNAADALDPTLDLAHVSPDKLIVVEPIPARQAIAVIRLRAIRPMTLENVREFTRQVSMSLAGEERRIREDAEPTTPDAAADDRPFSPAALKKRAGFIDRSSDTPPAPAG